MTALERILPTFAPEQREQFGKLLEGIAPDAWIASLDDIAPFEAKAKELGISLTPADWALQEQISRAITEPYAWTPTLPAADLYADTLGLGNDLLMPDKSDPAS
jgi:hypothetical protein